MDLKVDISGVFKMNTYPVYSYTSAQVIYKRECLRPPVNHGMAGESYFLYSATVEQTPWHIDPAKAWIDLDGIVANILEIFTFRSY
jgi:hypothetical protein